QLVARIVGLAAAGLGEALARRSAKQTADLVAFASELGEDLRAGQRAHVAEEEDLARPHTLPAGDPARAGIERRPVAVRVVVLEPLVATGPPVLVLGSAEDDPGVRRAEVAEVGVSGVGVALVGGDHVPSRLLEPQ